MCRHRFGFIVAGENVWTFIGGLVGKWSERNMGMKV